MYKGKHLKKGYAHKRPAALLASLILLLSVSVVGTVAYLMHSTEDVTNTFTLGQVPNKVVEDTSGTTKNNVKIQNLGDVDAYVRAAVVVNWIDADGNIYGGATPVFGTDYTWYPGDSSEEPGYNESDWTLGADGYYYYTKKVSANDNAKGGPDLTSALFTKCTQLKTLDGYKLSVEIMGQTIQADGIGSNGKPVVDAWDNDKINIQVHDNGTLSITPQEGGAST